MHNTFLSILNNQVWDLRAIRADARPLAHFAYHRQPVTSIEWAPHDESVLCLSSEDNQVTVWDLSVETDDEALAGLNVDRTSKIASMNVSADENGFPPQLLFIHQGQRDVKEIHYHPQIPGIIVSTAEDSFDIFKPVITVSS